MLSQDSCEPAEACYLCCMGKQDNPLHFEVSSGLKSVLGSELITDDEVAIFELVKNSFDANARTVHIFFDADRIIVADNGHGMTLEEVQSKWLFVAYSEKRPKSRRRDFRDEIAERKNYAGSKGIGRFSSDRLGEVVQLETRSRKETSGPVHRLVVDWNRFDQDHTDKFVEIVVDHQERPRGFDLPKELPQLRQGTVVTVLKPRRSWDRDAILHLKSALAKLINPFGAGADRFKIKIFAPSEMPADERYKVHARNKGWEISPNDLVNGDVGNFIFATLQEKTTFVHVKVDETGDFICSSLTDRGELIYEIREPNPYGRLRGSGFDCQVFFLNQSAKATFARRMGVPSVRFGSVFLFRNGFRVYPIGDEGDDWFKIDRRKQQGYARFLGTRDVIGRIDVSGADYDFQEASSRNTGLIETPAVMELRECFREKCLKRLERYVVPVTFVDREDKVSSDISRLLTDPGRARVTAALARLIDNEDVELVRYSKRLIGILDERSAQFESSLTNLRAIAESTQDTTLFRRIEEAEKRFESLRRAEEEARRQADAERQAKEEAEARALQAEAAVVELEEELEEEKKRGLFLMSVSTLDKETILNLHHQVTIYAVDINQQIENLIVSLAGRRSIPSSEVMDTLDQIVLLNRKIMGISKFATKANFRLQTERIEEDLGSYVQQYIEGVARDFIFGRPLTLTVANDDKGFIQSFKPIDVSVVIDNLIANAKTAHATKVNFEITHPRPRTVHIHVTDNGRGFPPKLKDLSRLFEKGFTTTHGSGLGLYHVSHVLGEMKGTIEAYRPEEGRGAGFRIRITV
jgi:signal transduction histidine kinase